MTTTAATTTTNDNDVEVSVSLADTWLSLPIHCNLPESSPVRRLEQTIYLDLSRCLIIDVSTGRLYLTA